MLSKQIQLNGTESNFGGNKTAKYNQYASVLDGVTDYLPWNHVFVFLVHVKKF